MRVISSFAVVFFHVCGAVDVPENLMRLVKFRDFALPVMVISSFFVLTVSLDQKPSKNFRSFFNLRFTRLFCPLIIWTIVYTIFFLFLFALLADAESAAGIFSPVVFLTGYRHLWYLQFIFIGSLIFYPIIVRMTDYYGFSRLKLFIICIAIAAFYQILYQISFRDRLWEIISADIDVNLQIFADQTSRYCFYIPVGIGLGLISKHIRLIFQNAFFRRISLVSVIIGMILHTRFYIPLSQEIYGLAIFIAALQPWKNLPFAFWKKLISYSYGVYILHFFWIHLLWFYTVNFNPEITAVTIALATIIVYFLSFLSAVLIRKFLPFNWLLPLINVNRKSGKNV